MSPASLNVEGKGDRATARRGGQAYKSIETRWGGSTEAALLVCVGWVGGENHSSIASAVEMLMLIV